MIYLGYNPCHTAVTIWLPENVKVKLLGKEEGRKDWEIGADLLEKKGLAN